MLGVMYRGLLWADMNAATPRSTLCVGLRANKGLKRLVLRANKVGANGGAGLADGLAGNKTLVELDMSRNTLSDEGLCSLARAMLINRTLKTMDVRTNGLIGFEGVKAITQVRIHNRTWTRKVDVCGVWRQCGGVVRAPWKRWYCTGKYSSTAAQPKP